MLLSKVSSSQNIDLSEETRISLPQKYFVLLQTDSSGSYTSKLLGVRVVMGMKDGHGGSMPKWKARQSTGMLHLTQGLVSEVSA